MTDLLGYGDVAPITYLTGAVGGDMVGGIIGGAIQGISSLAAAGINSGVNAYNVTQTNISNEKTAREARELQERMYNQSLALEERKFAEQQYENAIARWREDTEVQRRMADLEAAGINPLLAGKYDSQTGWGSVANAGIQGFTPITSLNQAAQIGINGGDWSGLTAALRERENRAFSASEAEKDRKLKSESIDIERFNAETQRMQEENTKEYNELKAKLEQQGLEQKEKEFLASQKNFYDQMNSDSQKFAEQISVEKRKAKTMEDKQALEELNSEVQRSLTTMQKLAISNEMTNEEKKIKLQEEKQALEAKFAKSANRREWMNSIWGNINKSIDSITNGIAKFLPGKRK